MAMQAPIPRPERTLPRAKNNAKSKSTRAVLGRAPNLNVGDDVVSSRAPGSPTEKQPETVVAAGKFKATCLQLLDRAALGETIVITKRGKTVGRLVPPLPEAEKAFVPLLGRMEGMVRVKGDIVGPRFDWWESK